MLLTGVKDLDFKILNELEDVDLVKMCNMNKTADDICKDQNFWLNRILFKHPKLSLDILNKFKKDRLWSEYYINDLRNINITNSNETLIYGSKNGRLDHVIISMNMAMGADIHAQGPYGMDDGAVRYASRNGHIDIVRYLVTEGADIHAQDDSAVRWASRNGHLDVVKYLVNEGADIHAHDDGAVINTSMTGHLDIVKYLVNEGADIHARDDRAVRLASRYGHLDVVKYLVTQGADIHAPGPDGINDYALRLAMRNGYLDVVKYLVSLEKKI